MNMLKPLFRKTTYAKVHLCFKPCCWATPRAFRTPRPVLLFATHVCSWHPPRNKYKAPNRKDAHEWLLPFSCCSLQANNKVMPESLLCLCDHVFPVNADSKKSLLSHTSGKRKTLGRLRHGEIRAKARAGQRPKHPGQAPSQRQVVQRTPQCRR